MILMLEKLDKLNIDELKNCNFCPRSCSVDRYSKNLGYCKCGIGFNISSICVHNGEEPVISGKNGICNIFFSHCNLQCVYCQNFQISRNKFNIPEKEYTLNEIIDDIQKCLEAGCKAVGFVSPSHFIPQMKIIINTLHNMNIYPVIVYNSNGYDKLDTIKSLEGMIDVYLPDFKYMDNELAKKYSDAIDYPEVATRAIKEMYRQMGSSLFLNEDAYAEKGLIIRHLVLPNCIENSISVLKYISEEISPLIHISLMSQYYPIKEVMDNNSLNRKLSEKEYERVLDALDSFGFYRGWVQELESSHIFRPDFNKDNPFE